MKVLILNSILFTAEKGVLPKVDSIKDCMIYNFALGFRELGHEVTLIAAEEYRPVQAETYDFEILFLKSNLKGLFKVSYFPLHLSLWPVLKKRKDEFDLIISSESFSTSSLIASLIAPSKLLIRQELFLHNRKWFKLPSLFWYNTIVRLFYRNVSIVPCSKRACDFISRYASKVSKTPVEHGIRLRNLTAGISKRNQFIVVSRLVEGKRIDLILPKFARFLSKYPQYASYQLYICGNGDMEEQLKARVKELKLEENVIFTGFMKHDELFTLLSCSKAMLVNSRKELNMVSIPEAISSGTPVITNTVPGNIHYIQDNCLGIVDDNWGEDDLATITENNAFFTANCLNYREQLSNVSAADKIINIFTMSRQGCPR
ncbi:MAG: glycosyltransferase family 4 protein [Tannerellaceae bacterium]|jgi:1,2-diacylglycerol 3-alpha-glucosyltransferase|nr:glycosyltransferase family 4 protein [Tannerellaceae bacterium]